MQETKATQEILGRHLRYDSARSNSEWSVWEHKTFNIHPGVLVWHPQDQVGQYSEQISTEVITFKRRGTEAEVETLPAIHFSL